MEPMFVDDAARARMADWFETFRGRRESVLAKR